MRRTLQFEIVGRSVAGTGSGPARWSLRALRLGALLLSLPIVLSLAIPDSAEARRRRMPYYKIREIHGEVAAGLGVDTEIRKTSSRRPGDSRTIDQLETILEQEITLGGSGWLYHPALTNLSADFGVIFNQDFQDSQSGRSTESFQNQLNYNVNLGILPYKPYPLSFFASQLRSQINSPFAPRQIVDTFRAGGGLSLRDLGIGSFAMPARMGYRYQETDSSSFSRQRRNLRTRHEVEFSSDNKSGDTRNRLRYNWKSIDSQSGVNLVQSARHDLRFSQQRKLRRGELGSYFFLNDNSGTVDTLSISANEHLRLDHPNYFSSDYTYGLSFQDNRGFSVVSHTAGARVSHLLYESLASYANAIGTYSDSRFGRLWTAGGGGELNYIKRIPGGSFGLQFAPQYLYTDEDIDDAIIPITEFASCSLDGSGAINLECWSIDLKKPPVVSLIVVKDSDGTTYDENDGWLLEDRPGTDFKTVRVRPGGPLEDFLRDANRVPGEGWLVEYSYRTEPARTFSTVTLASGFSLNLWKHFTFDFNYTSTKQNLLRGKIEQFTLDDSDRLLSMAEFRYANTRTRFEYERFWSRITPRERFTISHDVSFRPTRLSTLGIAAGYDHDRITDVDRLTQAASLNMTGGMVLPYRVIARSNILVRWLDQSEQNTFGAAATISFTYQYGRLRFKLSDQLRWRKTKAKSELARETNELINTLFFRVERPF